MLIAHKTKSTHFAFDSKQKIFVSMTSSLPRSFDFFSQIWANASDQGFVLDHGGVETVFTLSQGNYDGHGDLSSWRFDPISSSVLKNPDIKGVSVLIFNS